MQILSPLSFFLKIEFVIKYDRHQLLMISINEIFYSNFNEIAFNGWFPVLPVQSPYTLCVKVSDRWNRWCKLCKNCEATRLANLCSWYFYPLCVTFFKEVTSLVRIGNDRGWHHHWNRGGEKYLLILAIWMCVFFLGSICYPWLRTLI